MPRWENGYLTLGKWDGIPVRVHWTTPLGIIVLSGFRTEPVAWLALAFVIFVHELGHALMVRRVGAGVISMDLTGIGGECSWVGSVTPRGRASIAWGGVLAQALLLFATVACVAVLGRPDKGPVQEIYTAFTASNFLLLALNLVPVRPLDGVEAWRLVRILAPGLAQRVRHAHRAVDVRIASRRLDVIDKRVDTGVLDPDLDAQLQKILTQAGGKPSASDHRDPV